jgi:hypothetical protein
MSILLHPERYHGHRRRPPFFEGWYFKLVDASEQRPVRGHPRHLPQRRSGAAPRLRAGARRHDGSASYHRYPAEAFRPRPLDRFEVRVGPNRFSLSGLHLDIDDDQRRVTGGGVPRAARSLARATVVAGGDGPVRVHPTHGVQPRGPQLRPPARRPPDDRRRGHRPHAAVAGTWRRTGVPPSRRPTCGCRATTSPPSARASSPPSRSCRGSDRRSPASSSGCGTVARCTGSPPTPVPGPGAADHRRPCRLDGRRPAPTPQIRAHRPSPACCWARPANGWRAASARRCWPRSRSGSRTVDPHGAGRHRPQRRVRGARRPRASAGSADVGQRLACAPWPDDSNSCSTPSADVCGARVPSSR